MKELASPQELLSTPGSHFLNMVEEVGSKSLVSSLQKVASSGSLRSLSRAPSKASLTDISPSIGEELEGTDAKPPSLL